MNIKAIGMTMALCAFSSAASAAMIPFNISVNYGADLSVSQKQVFAQAEAFWESKILGYAAQIAFPAGLTIEASGMVRDGQGGVLGSAGPTGAYTYNGLYYASVGKMQFDVADLSWLEQNNSLYAVIVHEMAHVIGFGTLWELNGLYTRGTGQYRGSYGLNAYREEFSPGAGFVPIELDGGTGTADGHWDESWLGGSSDIMTGYLEGQVTISNTTLMSFRDLGYVVAEQFVEQPAPVSVGFAGMAMILLFGRRIQRADTAV